MQHLQYPLLRRNSFACRTEFVRWAGFKAPRKWARPFVVGVFRVRHLRLAVLR